MRTRDSGAESWSCEAEAGWLRTEHPLLDFEVTFEIRALIPVADIESPGGYLMFDNRKGRVEIRQITLRTGELNDPIPTNVISDKALKKSGGTSPEILHHDLGVPPVPRSKYPGAVLYTPMKCKQWTGLTRSPLRPLDWISSLAPTALGVLKWITVSQ